MHKFIKTTTYLLLVATLFICMGTSAFAAAPSIDHEQKGSIIVDYRHDDTPLDDVEFRAYHVAGVTAGGGYYLLPEFAGFDIDFGRMSDMNYWIETRNNLENYINYNMTPPEKTFITDDDGQYHLEDLDLGLYLIQAEMLTEGTVDLYSDPILIMVGQFDPAGNKWIYHFEITPKVSAVKSEPHTISVQKIWENTSSDAVIPQSITIELRCDGQTYDVVTLSRENLWKYTWENIDASKTWAIKELTELPDFKVSYDRDFFSFTAKNTYVEPPKTPGELPQTGSSAFLISMLACFGMVALLVGLVLKWNTKASAHEKANG